MQLPICTQGPSLPAGAPDAGAETPKGRSSTMESNRQGGNRGLRKWTCSELPPTPAPYSPRSPATVPIPQSWKPEVSFAILCLDFCGFFKPQRQSLFLSIFDMFLINICCCIYLYENGWPPLLYSSPESFYSSHTGLTFQPQGLGNCFLSAWNTLPLLVSSLLTHSLQALLLCTRISKTFLDQWI